MNKLTPKQKAFCQEYIVDFNGKQAAIRVGYSKNAAKEQGARLLTYDNVQSTLQNLMEKRSARVEIKADDVVRELKLIGFSRLNNYLSWDVGGVRMKDSEDLTDDQIACVVEIQETLTDKSSNIKFKLGDKLKALEMLGKHLGIFAEDNKQRKTDLNMTFVLGEKNTNPYVPGNRLAENVN